MANFACAPSPHAPFPTHAHYAQIAPSGLLQEVVNLTGENYASSLADGNTYFIKYYAPWCGHCKKLAPTWEELSNEVPEGVKIAHVDCTQQQDICTQQDIKGYPTLKLHRAGSTEGEKYQGSREKSELLAHATS